MWTYSFMGIVVALAGFQHWFIINTTPSLPVGLYMKTRLPVALGDTVLVCPPDLPVFQAALARRFLSPGLCPAGTEGIIKQVRAVEGDRICISSQGVWVNGHVLPGSARKNFSIGSIEDYDRQLAASEVLLMTHHPQSFDGRYFGPLDRKNIVTTLRPLWVKE